MNDNIKIGLLIVILAMVSLNTYKIFQIENVDVGKKVEVAPVKEKPNNVDPPADTVNPADAASPPEAPDIVVPSTLN